MRNIEINEVYTLFEEIKKLIKKGNDNTPTVVQPEIELPDLSAISELTDKLQEIIEEVRKPVRTECHHIFSITSNKIFFSVIGMGIALLVCMFMIYYQREEIATYNDNELKYRYVKMQGTITPDGIGHLENVFENKRDSIKIIRKQVKKYEKVILEEAKRLEQARLKEQEAERLRREADNLKQNK
jgi:predicted PurR-regulated permease PerM